MSFQPPLAHAGHWAIWALYAVPFLIVLWATIRSALHQRQERREGRPPPG